MFILERHGSDAKGDRFFGLSASFANLAKPLANVTAWAGQGLCSFAKLAREITIFWYSPSARAHMY